MIKTYIALDDNNKIIKTLAFKKYRQRDELMVEWFLNQYTNTVELDYYINRSTHDEYDQDGNDITKVLYYENGAVVEKLREYKTIKPKLDVLDNPFESAMDVEFEDIADLNTAQLKEIVKGMLYNLRLKRQIKSGDVNMDSPQAQQLLEENNNE